MAKNRLVAYYSWGGNTKAAAEYIADKAGAELLGECEKALLRRL
ncbi:MAG: hypothetical protein ACLSB9_13985 [Hydrogeniiclostridium mannosilyticum]